MNGSQWERLAWGGCREDRGLAALWLVASLSASLVPGAGRRDGWSCGPVPRSPARACPWPVLLSAGRRLQGLGTRGHRFPWALADVGTGPPRFQNGVAGRIDTVQRWTEHRQRRQGLLRCQCYVSCGIKRKQKSALCVIISVRVGEGSTQPANVELSVQRREHGISAFLCILVIVLTQPGHCQSPSVAG